MITILELKQLPSAGSTPLRLSKCHDILLLSISLISYPNIPTPENCLKMSQKILQWMLDCVTQLLMIDCFSPIVVALTLKEPV